MTTEIQAIPENFAAVEVNLAAHLPGYAPRPQQQRMAAVIEKALEKDESALVQAGCGTGKSLGGLIPALLHAKRNKTRVIVATATKALQEQYANHDVPFLQEHAGFSFTWALVKGRSNYACWVKLNSDDLERDETAQAVKAELKENLALSGDREHFAVEIDDFAWSKMSTSSAECPGKSQCAFGEICLAEKAKRKGLESDLVITNQAMMMTDLVLQEKTEGENTPGVQMLGDRGLVLFDEGHELPEYAASALGKEFKPSGVSQLFRDASVFAGIHGLALDERTDGCAMVMNALDEKMLPLAGQTLNHRWFLSESALFEALLTLLKDVYLDLSGLSIKEDADRQQAKLKLLQKRIANTENTIETLLLAKDHEVVRWVEGYEVKGQQRWLLKASPVDVAPFLTKMLWDVTPSVVMSATLSAGKNDDGSPDFSYIRRTLGLEAAAVDVGTPFDYSAQALMFVPDEKVASPKEYNRWATYAMATTLRLINASKGGALLLFTSRRAMDNSFADMAEALQRMGLTALKQGDGRSNRELARLFKEDEHSVLFALKSFFVGVDVPGNACRLVVIDKLPFPVPSDPIYQARELAEKRAGRRPFSSLMIPMMTLTLEQGVGRLIRTTKDSGVVAILDSRLTTEKYGRGIVSSLPDFPVTTKVENVEAFFQGERFEKTA